MGEPGWDWEAMQKRLTAGVREKLSALEELQVCKQACLGGCSGLGVLPNKGYKQQALPHHHGDVLI
eukprot:655531-Pelagomonas_calceolata.AAC.21